MPAHCVTIVTPDAASRRVSFAAEVEVIGVGAGGLSDGLSDATVCDRESRRVSFAEDVEVISTADRTRSISFAADVQVIAQSEDDVSDLNDGEEAQEGTMMIDADVLFEANESTATVDDVADILLDAIEGAEETVSDDDSDSNNSQALQLPAPPPRRSSLHWRLAPPQQQSRQRRGRLLPPNHTPPSSTLPPLTLPPPLLPLPEVRDEQTIPRSPPPPYSPSDTRTEDVEDDVELIARMKPPPAYDRNHPPPYVSVVYPEDHGDFVLEDLFTGVGGFFRGVGGTVVDAWRAMGVFEPLEEANGESYADYE